MRLTSVRAKNFKSFKDLDIRLDDLNVLVGANASGKSNFVQLFTFIRDIAKEGLENAISIQGGAKYLRNVNCAEDEPLEIQLSIEHDPREALVRSVYRFSLAFKGRQFSIMEDELQTVYRNGAAFTIRRVESRYRTEGDLGPFQIVAGMQTEDVRGERLLVEHLPWFAGLRSIATYDIDSKKPKTPLFGGKSELEPDADNLAIVLDRILSDDDDRRKLMNFLKDALPFVHGLGIEALSDRSLLFKMRELYPNHVMPSAFLSDGTIDVIALIVILYFERKPLVIIEEPERSLHPSLISRVVEYFKDASRLKQILITTHSPEIVRYADPGHLILITRDAAGFSHAERPADKDQVRRFLHDEISMHDLYVENLLEV